jgi:hypothetical protein
MRTIYTYQRHAVKAGTATLDQARIPIQGFSFAAGVNVSHWHSDGQ